MAQERASSGKDRLWSVTVEVEVRADSAVVAYARVHECLSRCPDVETVLVFREPEEAPPRDGFWRGGGGRPPGR